MSKLSPRQEAARKFVCPNCHAEAGRPTITEIEEA